MGFISGFGNSSGASSVSSSSSLSKGSWSFNGSTGSLTVGTGSSSSSSSSHHHHHSSTPAAPSAPTSFTKQTQSTVSKLEYVYGIKELTIGGKETAGASVYVSTPITVEGNVAQVMLVSDEEHPIFTPQYAGAVATNRCTSVEYYVTYVNHPTDDQWYAILPEGQTEIKNELLFFQDGKATLRFPALVSATTSVYADGTKLANDQWAFGPLGLSIIVRNRLPGVDYTVDYTPDSSQVNPYTIDFQARGALPTTYIGEDGREGEVFNGANHNCSIKLSHTPYIRYDQVNSTSNYNPNTSSYIPIHVYFEDANIAILNKKTTTSVSPYSGVDGVCTKNMTDYINKVTPVLKPYNLTTDSQNLAFEYYQDGDRLYFTETFNNSDIIANMSVNHGDAKIRVTYEYLVSNLRVKIILRRTGKSYYSSLSPIVHKYTLKILTLK